MNHYRINYVDIRDSRYKSFETEAETEDAALSALWDLYEEDFEHHIVEIIELGCEPASFGMRIGILAPPPLYPNSIQHREASYV